MEQKLAVISDVHGNYKALEAVLVFLWKDGRVQLLQENLAAKGEQGGTGVWQRESRKRWTTLWKKMAEIRLASLHFDCATGRRAWSEEM